MTFEDINLLRQIAKGEKNSTGPLRGSVVCEPMVGAGCQLSAARKLEGAGLVRLIKDPSVRGVQIAQLTEAGRAAMASRG